MQQLYNLFECKTCPYRSFVGDGCWKFSITRNEINSGYTIHTKEGGIIPLSEEKQCPYSIQINPERGTR